MRTIDTEIQIAAPAATVWSLLTAFADHERWDPFIGSIAGERAVGARLVVRFKKGFTFKPRVTALEEGRLLEWLGSLGVRGIFDGRHRFEIVEDAPARCTLRHSERFSGLLVPLLGGMLADTKAGFEAFNAAIAREAEAAWAKSAA